MKRCNVCKKVLSLSNQYLSMRSRGANVCKRCHKARCLSWEQRNRGYFRLWRRRYQRGHQLTTWIKGKQVTIHALKRPYPKYGKCELCGIKHKKLSYHHWDNSNILKGLWLDFRCHMLAECIDKLGVSLLQKYTLLRKKIGN